VADLLGRSRDPVHTLGRLLVLTGDALQSLPPAPAAHPFNGSSASPAGAVPRPIRTRGAGQS
jgi:hypothetical protein